MALVKAKAAVEATETTRPHRGFDVMAGELWSGEPGVRRAAVRDLAALPGTAAALCDRLDVEASPSVRSAIMTRLIQIGTPEVAVRLTEHLHSDDAQLRNVAIEALQEMPNAFIPFLDGLLADEDSDVRIFAVNILAMLNHEDAPGLLARIIRTDPHVNVCTAALDGLVEVGATEVISDIERLASRFPDSPFIRFAVDTAIRRIRGT